MATTRDRGSKSPTPSDDEFYDAIEDSDESDVTNATLHSATSGPPRHLSGRAGVERQDAVEQEAAKSDSASDEEMEGESLNDTADCSPAMSNLQSAVLSGPASKETDSASITSTLDSTTANGVSHSASVTSPRTAAHTSGSGSSSSKRITKRQSRLKWTAAAREAVVQADSDDGSFRRSSSSSSISSGSERRISASSMLEDIAQVRGVWMAWGFPIKVRLLDYRRLY